MVGYARKKFTHDATVLLALTLLLSHSAAGTAVTAPAAARHYEHLTPAQAPFTPVRVLDTLNMPVETAGWTGWGTKTLFTGPAGEQLRILYVPPGAEGAKLHYHEFHEWAYNIAGDFTNNESTMPEQVYGPLQRFREGDFLSRPPHSLHGGEKGRMKWMASQVGAEILIMEEKDAQQYSFTVDPDVRNDPAAAGEMRYNPDYVRIQHWETPRIIDTLDRMPWQPVAGTPGLNVKHLVDDPLHGFRADMWFLEKDAPGPTRLHAYYYRQANEFNYVIAGDLAIETYARPGAQPVVVQLGKGFYVEHPAMSIMGVPATGATRTGAVWLQVTYAKEAHWSDTPAPIEAPLTP